MSAFYTGKGDEGISHVGRKKIKKTCVEIVAVGDLDELNCLTGLAKHHVGDKKIRKIFETIQQDLFIIQAHVAACMFEAAYKPPIFSKTKTKYLEEVIDTLEKKIPPLKKFVIPGSTVSSAWCDYVRTLTRRAERSVLRHHDEHPLDQEVLRYMNRLSTLFFVAGRYMARSVKEKHPNY
jgi:cob(I)alamin adenosyltransferase